jgi:NAD+ synthase (glutamine-hydrolysing)
MGTFHDNRLNPRKRDPFRRIQYSANPPDENIGFVRTVERFPFVPSDESRLEHDCYEAYNIQVAGLVQRLRAIGSQRVVIGVSGGLDYARADRSGEASN